MNLEHFYDMPPGTIGDDATQGYVYRNLMRLAPTFAEDDLVAKHLANYKTAYQLALDCNLPGEEREKHKKTAKQEGFFLAARIANRVLNAPVLPIPWV